MYNKINQFKPYTKESVYSLGFLFADCYLYPKTHSIKLEIISDDFNEIKGSLLKVRRYTITQRNRPNRQPQTRAEFGSKLIYQWLLSHGYNKILPQNLLDEIPSNLEHYWWLGFFDGDGCFYLKPKLCYQMSLAGYYKQDWSVAITMLESLGITSYKVCNRTQGKNKNSIIRVTNRKDITKFGEYIYQNYNEDNIGLSRKKFKYDQIKT